MKTETYFISVDSENDVVFLEKSRRYLDISSLHITVFECLSVDGEKLCENGSIDDNRKRILSKYSVDGASADKCHVPTVTRVSTTLKNMFLM